MELFIRVDENNNFIEHPIVKENLLQVFPDIDLENLPSWLTTFERIEVPILGPYQVFEGTTYTWINPVTKDGAKDVHHIRQMTDEEKIAKQERVKEEWAASDAFPSWIFDEETCLFHPPIPYPENVTSGITYLWSEQNIKWVLVSAYPTDGGSYIFNPDTEEWEEVA